MNYSDVTSHAIACKVLKKKPTASPTTEMQLQDIATAMNLVDGKFKASFKKPDQPKWRAYFWVDKSGFRFSGSVCDYAGSGTCVGARLCYYFRSREASDHFGKKFFSLHKKMFNNK